MSLNEAEAIERELSPPFTVARPEALQGPLVFNSPHSGRCYPDRFMSMVRLDRNAIRRSEDCFVDELFGAAVPLGAPLLAANFPRAYIDVNREPWELDPAMFVEPLSERFNTTSPRVAAGLGTLARVVAENKPIYRERLQALLAFRLSFSDQDVRRHRTL